MATPAVPVGSRPVVVTTPLVNKLVFAPLALVFGLLFLTPYGYAIVKHDWKAPGDGSAGTSIVGYVITGILAVLLLATVPFLFRFHVDLWPDRIRKRILFGYSEMRISDARRVIMVPRKVNARNVAAEKWFISGTSTKGGNFRVTLDLGMVGDIPEAKAVMKQWVATRPDLEPSLFGRTSTEIHPEV